MGIIIQWQYQLLYTSGWWLLVWSSCAVAILLLATRLQPPLLLILLCMPIMCRLIDRYHYCYIDVSHSVVVSSSLSLSVSYHYCCIYASNSVIISLLSSEHCGGDIILFCLLLCCDYLYIPVPLLLSHSHCQC